MLNRIDPRAAALALVPLLAAGCGDTVGAVGEHGHIGYSLYTTYELVQDDLSEVSIVTEVTQTLSASLTQAGRDALGDRPASDITHELVPSDGTEVATLTNEAGDLWAVEVRADLPGDYTLQALLDGEVFEELPLHFDVPVSFYLSPWLRAPWSEDWTKPDPDADGNLTAEEGSQVTFEPVPKGADGKRLVGDLPLTIDAAPPELVVPGQNILWVYENEIVLNDGAPSWYLIEPGTVTFTVTDEAHDLSDDQVVIVTPYGG